MKTRITSLLAFTLIAASQLALAGSTVNIAVPSPAMIAPHAVMELPLDSLMQGVPYTVTCTLESRAPSGSDLHIAPVLAPDSGFGVVKLNDDPVLKNTGTLHSGMNTLSVMVSVTAGRKPAINALSLKNLDDQYPLSVKACQARPVTKMVTSAEKKVTGGYFYVTNHLPYFLDITVGNYFPTPYCIYPFLRQYIQVSTNNQDIDVVDIHY